MKVRKYLTYLALIVPAATLPNGSYTVNLINSPSYSGPVDIKSWVCDNRNPTSCTNPVEYKPWKNSSGQAYLFSNNQLFIDLTGLNIPEGIYHLQVATTPGNYGPDMPVNITKNALPHTPPYDSPSLLTLTQNAISKYLQSYPLLDLPGTAGQTINQIYANQSQNTDQKMLTAIQGTCGPFPNANYGDWRLCAAVFSYLLMSYHAYTNNMNMVTPYAYMIAFQLDSMISTASDPPLHGNTGPSYQLATSNATQGYINDAGNGIQSGLAWLKARNLIAQTYCTTLETPFDPGKSCKTIDLWSRIRHVAQRVIDGTTNYKTFPPHDPHYLARSASGRSVAAVVVGEPTQLANLKQEAVNYVSTELGTDTSTPIPVNYSEFAISDFFQHLQTVINVNNWVVPPEFQSLYQVWLRKFFGSYLDKTNSISNLEQNTYIESAIHTVFPTAIVNPCNQEGGDFHRTASGNRVVGLRGESLSDAITTSTPPLYTLLNSVNQLGLAQEVADITARSLNSIIVSPPSQVDEICDPSYAFGEPKNPLSVALRVFGYLFYTGTAFAHSPYQSFNNPPLYLGDANDDGRINNSDIAYELTHWTNQYMSLDTAWVMLNYGR